MKLAYFLQELKQVPLGYDFRMHFYGPYDSEVLSDLKYAESLQFLKSEVELFSKGYRYKVTPGPLTPLIHEKGDAFVSKYNQEIGDIVRIFGAYQPSELELLSTIHYTSAYLSSPSPVSMEEIAARVKAIKPHFSLAQIQKQILWLRDRGFIQVR